jgi:hypothetical protein
MVWHGREYAAAFEAAFPFVSNLLAAGQSGGARQIEKLWKISEIQRGKWLRVLDLDQRPPGYEFKWADS